MAKMSTYSPDSTPTSSDYLLGVDAETGVNKRVLYSALKTLIQTDPSFIGTFNGWVGANETWVYASGTGTNQAAFTVTGVDVTGKYQAGDRVQFTQTTVKYGIIVKTAFSSDTTISIYMGTDYTMANAAITSNSYSKSKSPQGFPLDPIKWTQTYTYSDDSTTTSATYAQVGSHQLSIPIGSWDVLHKGTYEIITAGANISTGHVALSTATNSVSDAELGHTFSNNEISSIAGTLLWPFFNRKVITVTTPTIYYQIFARDSALTHGVIGSKDTGYIKAICAYL